MSNVHHKLDRAFAGGLAWTAGAKWVTQMVSWVALLFSARLLSPTVFGAVEMASFVTVLTNILAEFGIGSSVLQMRELDRRTLGQLNSVSLLFSTLAFAVSTALIPLVAAFFHTQQLMMLMFIANLGYFLTGVQAVPMGLVERDMDYKRLSIAESAAGITQALVTVAAAAMGFGYWSLLAGPMASRVLSAGLFVYWKPLPFALPRRSVIMAPMRFGFQVAVSRVGWAVYSQSDAVIVGRMLGPAALGSYRLAMNLASAPAEKVGLLIMRVTGPLFSKVQNDQALVKRYFLFVSDGLALVIFPLAAGLIVVAPEVVTKVLGPQWNDAIVPVQWLAGFLALRMLNAIGGQVLVSLRHTSFSMWMSLITSVIMPVAFYIAAPHGTGAVAMTWFIMSPVILLPPMAKLLRSISCTFWEYFKILAPASISSGGMALAVLAAKRWLIPGSYSMTWRLVLEIVCGGLSYAAILGVFYRPVLRRYFQFAMRLRSGRDAVDPASIPEIFEA